MSASSELICCRCSFSTLRSSFSSRRFVCSSARTCEYKRQLGNGQISNGCDHLLDLRLEIRHLLLVGCRAGLEASLILLKLASEAVESRTVRNVEETDEVLAHSCACRTNCWNCSDVVRSIACAAGLPVVRSVSRPPSPKRLAGRLLLAALEAFEGSRRMAVKNRSGGSGVAPAVAKKSLRAADGSKAGGEAGGGVASWSGKKDEEGRDSSRIGESGVVKKDVVSMLDGGEPKAESLGARDERLPPFPMLMDAEPTDPVELPSEMSPVEEAERDRDALEVAEGVGLSTRPSVGLSGSSLA